jgi:dTDP-4-dehydrorhamnose 3,5-epimerase
MKFQKAMLEGVWHITLDRKTDERGFFARTWCKEEFEKQGLDAQISQCSTAFNAKKATLRGMHFQKAPFGEIKMISCARGAVYDVLLDLRPESKTFCKWMAVILSEDDSQILYVPEGIAHGYQTLTHESQLFYQMNRPYEPSAASGVRWNDPTFDISWPEVPDRIMSDKDSSWPDFKRSEMESYASFQRAS